MSHDAGFEASIENPVAATEDRRLDQRLARRVAVGSPGEKPRARADDQQSRRGRAQAGLQESTARECGLCVLTRAVSHWCFVSRSLTQTVSPLRRFRAERQFDGIGVGVLMTSIEPVMP